MQFLKSIYHFFLSWLGDVFYRHPSRKIFVIGITGTKGKTTCAEVINAVLEAAGKKTAILNSVRVKVGEKNEPNASENTMPGRFAIKRFLRRAVRAGCEYAILEVTSQGVLQFRHRFIDWDAAVFLNLHPEHIEAHGSFERYRDAKVKFFSDAARLSAKPKKLFLINGDDPNQSFFANEVRGHGEVILFSAKQITVSGWLSTEFNRVHAAAALAFAKSQGIDEKIALNALNNFKGVPGRMEIVQEKPFRVVVDYAHTPDSLEAVYKELASDEGRVTSGKLICVLGSCGGGRDKWKRPVLGKIAAEYCDQIILTNEDPYDEKPSQILSEIKSEISNSKFLISNVFEILDRQEAIKRAISLVKEGDTVILTGKGSERWIHVAGGRKIPWNEREIAEKALKSAENTALDTE